MRIVRPLCLQQNFVSVEFVFREFHWSLSAKGSIWVWQQRTPLKFTLSWVPMESVLRGFHGNLTSEGSTRASLQTVPLDFVSENSTEICFQRIPPEFILRGFHWSLTSEGSTGICLKRIPTEFDFTRLQWSLTSEGSTQVWLQRVPLEFVRGGSTGVCFYQGSTIPTLQQWDTSQQFQTDTWGCRSSLHCTQNNGKRMPMGNTWH